MVSRIPSRKRGFSRSPSTRAPSPTPSASWSAADLEARLLYEDAEFLVLDKPAGLAVHAGPKTPESLADHLDALRFGFARPPQPAHRLDRDTSGCLLLARNPRVLKRVQRLFEAGEVEKTYLALLDGRVEGEGTITLALKKISSKTRGWRMIPAKAGQSAETHWRALAPAGDATLVEFRPRTGRTHQLRVHAAEALAPILGDPVYGDGKGPMRLHAARLAFPWKQDRCIEVEAPLPPGWPKAGSAN